MRFLEALLIAFAAIYLFQLLIASLLIATLLLFLWCLYKRPREALILALAVLAVAFISKPVGAAVVAAVVLAIIVWVLVIRIRQRRPTPLLTYRPDD